MPCASTSHPSVSLQRSPAVLTRDIAMRSATFGHSGLIVSRIVLDTMTFAGNGPGVAIDKLKLMPRPTRRARLSSTGPRAVRHERLLPRRSSRHKRRGNECAAMT